MCCGCCICIGIAMPAMLLIAAPMAPATAPMGSATGTHCGVA